MSWIYPFFLLIATLLFLSLLMLLLRWVSGKRRVAACPYTGRPLRRALEIPFLSMYRIRRYMDANQDFYNRPFSFRTAAFSRETGRIYPDSVNWRGEIHVDWSFLLKRFPGHFVSWGSLSLEKQRLIREKHTALTGFQTERSSARPAPQEAEKELMYLIPGPLYVDPDTGVLLGWKRVPETPFEILVVQRPL